MTTTTPSRISARPSVSVRGWPRAGTSAAGRAPSRGSSRPRSPTATRPSVSSPAISTRGTASPSPISSSGRSTAPSRSTTRCSAPTRRNPSPSMVAGWRSRRRATWWGRRRTCSRPGRFGRTSPTSSRRWVSSPTGASLAYSRTCERETAGTRQRGRGSAPAASPARLTRRPPGGAQDEGVPLRRSAPPPPPPPAPITRVQRTIRARAEGGKAGLPPAAALFGLAFGQGGGEGSHAEALREGHGRARVLRRLLVVLIGRLPRHLAEELQRIGLVASLPPVPRHLEGAQAEAPRHVGIPRQYVHASEPHEAKRVVRSKLHGLRPLDGLFEESDGLWVPALEGIGEAERSRYHREEQRDVGEPGDDEGLLEGLHDFRVLPAQELEHARADVGNHHGEGMIHLAGQGRRGLRLRGRLLETSKLAQTEGEPRPGHDGGQSGEPEELTAEIALE